MSAPVVGVDLGGTSIRAAVATGPGVHGPVVHRDTPAGDGPRAVLTACAEAVREASGGRTPSGVAIGIPGPLNPASGVVSDAPHLTGWSGVNARDMLSELAECPVAIQNDAGMAGYAEWKLGAGKDSAHFIFITASTGIGGALVLNGVLHHGFAGSAGEVGHMTVAPSGPECGQGHPGCLEGAASGSAIARQARAAVEAGAATSLRLLSTGAITAMQVQEAGQAGDEVALGLFHAAGHALGRAVGTLINVLSPEVVAVGGGLMHAGDMLFAPLRMGVREIAFRQPLSQCRIEVAALGTDAGLVGAVAWAVETFALS